MPSNPIGEFQKGLHLLQHHPVTPDYTPTIHAYIDTDFGDETQYLSERAIPAGQAYTIFQKAHQIWKTHQNFPNIHENVKPIWINLLFQPLLDNVLRSQNPEDLAAAHCWITHSRFAFGFKAGHDFPQVLTDNLQAINAQLISCIGGDKIQLVTLLEWLNGHTKNDEADFDSYARDSLCLFLCRQYYHNQGVALSDLTDLCSKDIKALASPNGSNSHFYLAALLACKAEKVYAAAEPADQEAFIEAFKGLALFFQQHSSLDLLFNPFVATVTPLNFLEKIGAFADRVNIASHPSILS